MVKNTEKRDLSAGVLNADDVTHQKVEDLTERPTGTNQSRRMGLMKKSSDYDQITEENPFTKMESNPHGGCHSTGKGR